MRTNAGVFRGLGEFKMSFDMGKMGDETNCFLIHCIHLCASTLTFVFTF